MPGQRRISSASSATSSSSAGIASRTRSIASRSSARTSQKSSPAPGTTLNASPERITVGTAVRWAAPCGSCARGDELRGLGEREQRVAAAVRRGAAVGAAAVRGDVDRARRLAPDHDALVGAGELARLEAQARVEAGEARRRGRSRRCATPRRRRAAARAARRARARGERPQRADGEDVAALHVDAAASRAAARRRAAAAGARRARRPCRRGRPAAPCPCRCRAGGRRGPRRGRGTSTGRARSSPRRAAARRTPRRTRSRRGRRRSGDDTATSASSSRGARLAISAAASLIHGSIASRLT